jgi:hypothetical protein
MTDFRKTPTQKEVLDRIKNGSLRLSPLSIRLEKELTNLRDRRLDAIVDLEWQGQSVKCAVEIKTISNPRAIRDAASQIKEAAAQLNLVPLIIVPFLSDEELQELERKQISGIDLCGNGIVVVPSRLTVYRTGAPNNFRRPAAIVNIYRRNTSVVGRVFLARASYQSVTEILNEIEKRTVFPWWTSIRLSTVSKALKSLEEDLIVAREDNLIRLLQAEKLLDKLSESYAPLRVWPPPEKAPSIKLRVPLEQEELLSLLSGISATEGIPIVGTGLSSTWLYATMQRGPMLSVYCPFVPMLVGPVKGEETDRFPNLEIIEVSEQFVYFDSREKAGFRWASPVQTYLELMSGDKRDRETAEQVKAQILTNQQQ